MYRRILGLCLVFISTSLVLQAQLSLSPYSRYGLGSILDANSTRNFAMGGLGIGISGRGNVNRMNPATYGDLRLTTLELSTYGGWNHQSTDLSSTYSGNAGLHNVSFAFPTNKNFALVMGLAPYSRTGYDITTSDSILVDGTAQFYRTNYASNGGLNKVFLGVGTSFLQNRLNAGVNLSFAFGNSNYSWTNDFVDASFATVTTDRRVLLSGLIPRFGVQYADFLKYTRKEDQVEKLEKEEENLKAEEERWIREEQMLLEENEKILKKAPKVEEKQAEIQKEMDALQAKIEVLAENERDNEKEIDQLQKKKNRYQRQYKRLGNRIFKPRSANEKDLAIARRRQQQYQNAQKRTIEQREDLIKRIEVDSVPRVVKRKDSISVRLGAIFEPAVKLRGSELIQYNNGAVFDTLSYIGDGNVALPLLYGVGVSISKPRKWTAGADLKMQNWQNFTYFSDNHLLNSSMEVTVGGEYIPVFNSVKYRNRIALRAGANYRTSNLTLNDQAINEVSVSVGMGLPLGKPDRATNIYSRINLGLAVGRQGTKASGLLQENFIRFRLGVSLNDKWFIKRKFD